MADYVGTASTNWFTVNDIAVLGKELEKLNDGIQMKVNETDGRVMLFVNDRKGFGGWPTVLHRDDGTMECIDFPVIVSKHLSDGEVATFAEVATDELGCPYGRAVAIDNKGRKVDIGLDDVYKKAKGLLKSNRSSRRKASDN